MKQTAATILTVRSCLDVLKRLDQTPTVKVVSECLSSQSFEKLYNGEIPFPDTSSPTFVVDYFAFNLLRKYPFRGVDREAAAITSFVNGEVICRETNRRLLLGLRGKPTALDAISRIRAKISSCLGTFCWDSTSRDFAFGPGASTRLLSREGDVYFKFRGIPETTRNNLPLATAAIACIPNWFGAIAPNSVENMCTVVAGSKVTTVPKNAKTDRTIAIEPCMNMYVQKGIGTAIRNRLRRVGVDLNDQTRNQTLAQRAYSDGLSTIDLSAASDTVCYEIVDLLLPGDWASALKQCRSPRYILDSQIYSFEKFSTMGNGYTFELESLLFWAITSEGISASGSRDRTIGIFGDDIICPRDAFDSVVELLSFFGFTTNKEKSFKDGPFFESCGKHYLRGSDVTPVYVDKALSSPFQTAWFYNSIARWCGRVRHSVHPKFLWDACKTAFSTVHPLVRLPIPDGVGDGGCISVRFLDSWTTLPLSGNGKQSVRYQRGHDYSQYIETVRLLPDRDPSDAPYLLKALYRLDKVPSDYLSRVLYGPEKDQQTILRVTEWSTVRGWSTSWPIIDITAVS